MKKCHVRHVVRAAQLLQGEPASSHAVQLASSPELIQRLNPLSVRPRRLHAMWRRRETHSCDPALVADIQAQRHCLCGFLPAERRAEELFNASTRFMTPANRIAGLQSKHGPESTRDQQSIGGYSGHYPSLTMILPLNYSWARFRMTSLSPPMAREGQSNCRNQHVNRTST
jgi:hypothetical protein